MIKVFNTLSRQKENFTPITPGKVGMYVCGMTTYDYCHIGHARMLVAFDIIYRWLRALNYQVNYVRNITDVDDKIIKRAAENQETIQALTLRFIQAMHEDIAALNILPPSIEPKATDHIPGMISMIETLILKGKAYAAANGDVYYAVREFDQYGQLSGKTLESLRAGERVEIDKMKRDPFDFVLWKAAKLGEPSWNSPWGPGRPGWHIECSVMSCDYLGEHFDIHGGGADLQFPHHENEIAQSKGTHGSEYVNYWLHNGFITVDGIKMSKSLGNFYTIRDVLSQFNGEVIRFFIVRSHYRSAVNYTLSAMTEAAQILEKLYRTLRPFESKLSGVVTIDWDSHFASRFADAMNDDFNTPVAITVLQEMSNEINKTQNLNLALQLKGLGNILGLFGQNPDDFLKNHRISALTKNSQLSEETIEEMINQRNVARAAKNWAESDRIRDELSALGVLLEDGKNGTIWNRK